MNPIPVEYIEVLISKLKEQAKKFKASGADTMATAAMIRAEYYKDLLDVWKETHR